MTFVSRRHAYKTLGAFALLCLASVNLAGCVTDQAAANAGPAPIAPGQAVVTITRTDAYQAALLAANVTANGEKFASIERGTSFTGGIKPGPVTLTVTAFGSPGEYTIHFNAAANKRYAFQIEPRPEQMVAGMAVGLVGVLAETAINGEQSGTFKIAAVAGG